MLRKTTLDTAVAIQTRLIYLRNRKRVIDELIVCLEVYGAGKKPSHRHPCARLGPRLEVRPLLGVA
jgi:hypothetical protein